MFDLDTPFPATDSQNNQKQLQRYVSLTIYTKLDHSVYLISLHVIIFISLRGKYSRGLIITGLHNVTTVNYSLCNPLSNSSSSKHATTAFENIIFCNNNFFPYFTSFYITRKCKK